MNTLNLYIIPATIVQRITKKNENKVEAISSLVIHEANT